MNNTTDPVLEKLKKKERKAASEVAAYKEKLREAEKKSLLAKQIAIGKLVLDNKINIGLIEEVATDEQNKIKLNDLLNKHLIKKSDRALFGLSERV